jgi:hypothetical protein
MGFLRFGKAAAKNVDTAADIGKAAAKNVDTAADIAKLAKSGAKGSDELKAALKQINTAEDAAKTTGRTPGVVKQVTSKVTDALEENPKAAAALTKAGLVAAAIGALMLLTGETNPLKAIGKATGEVFGGLAEGLGIDLKTIGLWIGGGLVVLLLIFILFKFMDSKKQ